MGGTTAEMIASQKKAMSSYLTMELHGPGMSLLDRAGLGGLSCSLVSIERGVIKGELSIDQIPGWPWLNGRPPWEISPWSITLNFGRAEAAAEYLKRLFALSFQINESGVIYLPGQFQAEPRIDVLAAIHNGLTLTFIQHGKTRTLAKVVTLIPSCDPLENKTSVPIEFKSCSWFKHQDGWKSLVTKSGKLTGASVEVIGPLNPGAIVRHVAFSDTTKLSGPPNRVLPLYFAIVGCLTLPLNRGSGVLIVPEVDDLEAFMRIRPLMTPRNDRECQVANAADAVLQAEARIVSREDANEYQIPGFYAVTFRPTEWASQQKSRVDSFPVPPGDPERLKQFAIALEELKPYIGTTVVKSLVDRGEVTRGKSKSENFWSDSNVRPMVADNLVRNQPWYRGFVKLFTKFEPNSRETIHPALFFEKEGLKAMIEKIAWQDQGEGAIVRAVHEALRRRFRTIAGENERRPITIKNRMSSEFDRWRVAFTGAKTADQFRHSLCDLFALAGMNSVLREKWELILAWLGVSRWQLTRDLALLALASYTATNIPENADADTEVALI